MPRYVILRHETPPEFERPAHLDFMFEAAGVLRTFALPHIPAAGEIVSCEQLADHRLAYLDYEGEISGGRGSVTRYDAGSYEIVNQTSQMLVVRLSGQQHRGTLSFKRAGDGPAWQATWHPALSGV